MNRSRWWLVSAFVLVAGAVPYASTPLRLYAQSPAQSSDSDIAKLVAALQADTPMLRDAQVLTDVIGGRPTGSAANLRSVDWAVTRFREAGVSAEREVFKMPAVWLEVTATAAVQGEGVHFTPRIAAMPFSAPTLPGGFTAPLLDAGKGAD